MKITGDLHIHTNLSSCAASEATWEKYVECAKNAGISTLCFTNHLWDSSVPGASAWYAPQTVEHVLQLKKELPSCMEADGIKLLFGCETEFTHEGKLCLAEENMDLFEVILVPHSHTHMKCVMPDRTYADDNKLHAKFLMDSFMRAVEHPLSYRFTAIAHPFVPGTKYEIYNAVQSYIPDSYLREAFCAAREKGIAIEINGSCVLCKDESDFKNCEYLRIFSIAKECGSKFTYGSDSHNFKGDRNLAVVEKFIDACGITESDMLKL